MDVGFSLEEIVENLKKAVQSTGGLALAVTLLEIYDDDIAVLELYKIINDIDFVKECMNDKECWEKWRDIRCSYPDNRYPCVSLLWYLSHIRRDENGYKVVRI